MGNGSSDTYSLSVKEFRVLLRVEFRQDFDKYLLLLAQTPLDEGNYGSIIPTILLLKEAVEQLLSLLTGQQYSSSSVMYASRYRLISSLRIIEDRAQNLIFQVLVLQQSSWSLSSSSRLRLQLQKIHEDLEAFLDLSKHEINTMLAICDQLSFMENSWRNSGDNH